MKKGIIKKFDGKMYDVENPKNKYMLRTKYIYHKIWREIVKNINKNGIDLRIWLHFDSKRRCYVKDISTYEFLHIETMINFKELKRMFMEDGIIIKKNSQYDKNYNYIIIHTLDEMKEIINKKKNDISHNEKIWNIKKRDVIMNKNEIEKSMKFRKECSKYGLDWKQFNIFLFENNDYVILLKAPNKNICVLLDKNYNTIGIERLDVTINSVSIDKFAREKYNVYCNCDDNPQLNKHFEYPFGNVSLKQIIDLSDKIEIVEINNGHSFRTMFNGVSYDREENEKEIYVQILSYIKFLGEQIKQYFLYSYQMQMIGCEELDVYNYVRHLIKSLNSCVVYNIGKNKRTYPSDILNYIGQSYQGFKFDGILYDIVNLIMKDKGYEIDSDNYDEIKAVDQFEMKQDLSLILSQLIRALEQDSDELNLFKEYEEIGKTTSLKKTKKDDSEH